MMPKWRVSCSFAPSSLLWGGWGIIVPFYTVQDCRLRSFFFLVLFIQENRNDLLAQEIIELMPIPSTSDENSNAAAILISTEIVDDEDDDEEEGRKQ